MTYNVFGGTLNITLPINQPPQSPSLSDEIVTDRISEGDNAVASVRLFVSTISSELTDR